MSSSVTTALMLGLLLTPLAPARDTVKDATLCPLVAQPAKYNGKMVRVRGRIIQGPETFFLKAEGCALDLAYPDDPADLGPAAMYQEYPWPKSRAKFKVNRDENYKKLVDYANAPAHLPEGCFCLACYRYQVTATITGLIEVAKRGQPGFGHMNAGRERLVIRSISDVEAVDMASEYQNLQCGPPRLKLPASPYPGLDFSREVPPFESEPLKPK